MASTDYIGIIIDDKVYRSMPAKHTGQEKLVFYEEAAREYGLRPVLLPVRKLKKCKARVSGFVWKRGRWQKRKVPHPKIIHNRVIFQSREELKIVKRLIKRGILVFNPNNRYSKLYIHSLLKKDESLRPHLPATEAASADSVRKMLNKYPSLIIKPARGSIGRGIMRLKLKDNGKWELLYPRAKSSDWSKIHFKSGLPRMLLDLFKKRSYLVQERIPLAQYKDSPFDIRVSVQRDATGCWQITGMVGKVAKPGAFLTNVAQGGTAYPLSVLLKDCCNLQAEKITDAISDLSLRIANQISLHLPGLADLGLDIGITADGHPMFIEANGRDQRYSFREAGMLEDWKATFRNPMGYAYFLSNGMNKQD